jgi:hypothetical protein
VRTCASSMSITIDSMIDTPRRQAARQPLNRHFQVSSKLISRWKHEPGSRLIPRWKRLGLSGIERRHYDVSSSRPARTSTRRNQT